MATIPYRESGGKPVVVKRNPPVKVKAPPNKTTVANSSSGASAAQQIVNAALAPLLAQLKSQETSTGLTNLRQQDALSGFTKEIVNYLKGTPAAIQSDYQGAVDTTRNLAQASADELLKANPNSLNQADLAAINAPQSQRDALTAQNQNVYGGGSSVLFKTAGAIPATAFAEDKATAKAFADSLPAIQGLAGTQAFQKLLASQGEGLQKLAEQRAEIEAKRPGLLLDAQASIAKAKNDERNYALKVQSAGLAQDRYRLSVAKMNSDLAYKTANLSLSDRRVVVSEQNSANSAYFRQQAATQGAANFYQDQKGRTVPKGYKYNAQGQLIRISTGSKSSTTRVQSGLTKSESVKQARAIAAVAVGNAGPIITDPVSGQKGRNHLTYQEAMQQMRSAGVSLVDAQRALNAFWTKPGQVKSWEKDADGTTIPGAGRPLKSFQQLNPGKTRKNVSYDATAKAESVTAFAAHQIGKPYVFGSGADFKSFDCSDLIQAAYKQVGIRLPRTTYGQIKSGRPVTLADIQPGDLVFPSNHHVILYVGAGKVIAAPHTGALVQYQDLADFGKPLMIRRVLPNQREFV